MEAGCEPRKVTHDLRVGFIIRPTLSVPRLPGRRMIADRVPPASQSPSPFLSIFLCCQSTLCQSPRVRANFSDSVTSLLIASSLVQLSPVTAHKTRLSIFSTDDLELQRANEKRTGDKYIFGHGACTGVKKLVLTQLKLDAQGVIRAKISRTSPGFAPISGRTLPNASSPPPLSRNLGFSSFPDFPAPQIPKPQKWGKQYRSRVRLILIVEWCKKA